MLCSNALGIIKASCRMQKCKAFLLMFFNYLVLSDLARHLALSKHQAQINLGDPAPLTG